MTKPTLTALILGPSGHGKSWLASTAPAPRLIFDLEGRAGRTPNGKEAVYWDGSSDPLKLEKSDTRTFIVDCTRGLAPLDAARQWLRSGRHQFRSVAVDSLMEVQWMEQQKVVPGIKQLQTQDWGVLLRAMEAFVRDLVDMTKEPATKVECVVLISGAIEKDGMQKPLMQGQIVSKIPYWMDVVGFLEKVYAPGGDQRRLWLTQRPEGDLETKDGTDDITQKFGSPIRIGNRGDEPNLDSFFQALG